MSNVTLPLSIQTAPMFAVTRPKAMYQKELFVKLSLIIIFWFRFWATSKSPLLCGKPSGNSASEKSNTQHSVIDPFHWTSPKKKLTISPTATNIKAWALTLTSFSSSEYANVDTNSDSASWEVGALRKYDY